MKKFFKVVLWVGIIGAVVSVVKKFIPNCCGDSDDTCCEEETETDE
jgi:hypothetical protein